MPLSDIPARIWTRIRGLGEALGRRFNDGRTPVLAALAMGLLSLALLLFFLLGERPREGERFAVPDDDGILTAATRVHPRSPLAPAVRAFRSGYRQKAIGLLRALLKRPGLRIPEKRKVLNYIGYIHLATGNRREAEGAFRASLRVDSGNPPALHGLGRIAQIERRFSRAVSRFSEAIRVNPRFRKSHWRLGQSLYSLKKYGKAAGAFRAALDLAEDARIRYELGNTLLALGKPLPALIEYKRVLDFSPDRVLLGYASARIGDIQEDRQRPAEAIQYYRLAVRYYPGKFAFSYNLGILLLKNGKREEALTLFRSVLPIAPDNRVAALTRTLGEIHYDSGRYDDALKYFRLSLGKQDDLDVAAVVADLHYLRKDYDTALRIYEQIIGKYPDSPQAVSAMVNCGNIGLLQEKFDEALRWYKRALKQDPKNSRLWYNMGIVFWRQKLFARAESAFRRAARLDPLNDAALRSQALAVLEQGELRRALNLYLTAIADRGDRAGAWMYIQAAALFRQVKEFDNAVRFIRRALKMGGERDGQVRALHELARVYLDRGEPDKLFAVLHRARALKAGDPLTGYLFGLGLLRAGRYREAREAFSTALLYRPDETLQAELHFRIGTVDLRSGRYARALTAFRKTLDLVPTHSAAQYNASVCVRELQRSGR